MNKKQMEVIFGSCVILVVVVFLLYIGKIKVKMDEQKLTISATLTLSSQISWDEIKSVEYLESLGYGKRVVGNETSKLKTGTFKNNTYGKYRLYAYAKVKAWIEIKTNHKVIVLNQASVEETKELYDRIYSKYKALGVN